MSGPGEQFSDINGALLVGANPSALDFMTCLERAQGAFLKVGQLPVIDMLGTVRANPEVCPTYVR